MCTEKQESAFDLRFDLRLVFLLKTDFSVLKMSNLCFRELILGRLFREPDYLNNF